MAVAIDESLRHDPPGAFTARTCLKHTQLGVVRIEPGAEVVLSIASVNRASLLPAAVDISGGRFLLWLRGISQVCKT